MSNERPAKYPRVTSHLAADLLAIIAQQAGYNVSLLKILGALRNGEQIPFDVFSEMMERTTNILSQVTEVGKRIPTEDDL